MMVFVSMLWVVCWKSGDEEVFIHDGGYGERAHNKARVLFHSLFSHSLLFHSRFSSSLKGDDEGSPMFGGEPYR